MSKSEKEIALLENIERLKAEIKTRQTVLAEYEAAEQVARGERLALGPCDRCKRRLATGRYGGTPVCDVCHGIFDREFEDDYS